MKKILMMALALCLMGGAALADTESTEIRNDSATQTATTTLSYKIDESQSYIVTIPASVVLDKGDNNKLSGSLVVTLDATGFNANKKGISVKMSQYSGSLSREGQPGVISFNVYKGSTVDEENELVTGSEAISWTYDPTGPATVSQTLLIDANYNSSLPAGTYTGSLTFEVSMYNIL